jgi:hypothetical protein
MEILSLLIRAIGEIGGFITLAAAFRAMPLGGTPWVRDKNLHLPGRAELPLCPELLGGAAAPPCRRREVPYPAPTEIRKAERAA